LRNKLLRRIFGPKREERSRDWKKLSNEKLHNLYASPSIISVIKLRRIRLAAHVVRMREMRNAYKIFVGKPGGKTSRKT
jgi:hypothetical protein